MGWIFGKSHIHREHICIASVDIFCSVNRVTVNGRKGWGAGHYKVNHFALRDIFLKQQVRFEIRQRNGCNAEFHRWISDLFLVYIFFHESFKARSAGTVIENDFPGILDRLTAFRDIENHVGLHLFPEAAGQFKLVLSYHGSVDCTYRGSGYNIYLYTQFS